MIDVRIYTAPKKDSSGGSRSVSIYATTGVNGAAKIPNKLKGLELVQAKNGIFDRLQVNEYLNCLQAYIKELSSEKITTEFLEVTKSAHFFELIIDKIKAAGGAVLFTPADGFVVEKVVQVTNGKKLYWRANDPMTGRKNVNMWQVNDQALCQNFNQAVEGTSYDIRSKYYWSLVTDVSSEPEEVNLGTEWEPNNQMCNYIVISTETYDGYVDPEVQDNIVMLGHRGDDDARKSAVYIAAYKSLDGDLVAPLFATYTGIDDFNLADHKRSYIATDVTAAGAVKELPAVRFIGQTVNADGRTTDQIALDLANGIQNVSDDLSEFSEETQQAVTTINDTITSQGNTITSLSGTVSSHTTSISNLSVAQNSISATVSSHTTTISNLSGTVSSQGTAIGTMQSTIETHTTQISSLSVTQNSISATVSSHTTSIGTITTSLNGCKDDITYIKQNYATTGYVTTTANNVKLGVIETIENEIVSNTGINIKTGQIDMTANTIQCNGSSDGATWIKFNDAGSYPRGMVGPTSYTAWNSFYDSAKIGAGTKGGFISLNYNTSYDHIKLEFDGNNCPIINFKRGSNQFKIWIDSAGRTNIHCDKWWELDQNSAASRRNVNVGDVFLGDDEILRIRTF